MTFTILYDYKPLLSQAYLKPTKIGEKNVQVLGDFSRWNGEKSLLDNKQQIRSYSSTQRFQDKQETEFQIVLVSAKYDSLT